MKKIIATVLTALLLLSVVACENVSDESYVQTAESSGNAAFCRRMFCLYITFIGNVFASNN